MSDEKLACFIHTALFGTGRLILYTQFKKLQQFGLLDKLSSITVGTVGPGPYEALPLPWHASIELDAFLSDPKVTVVHHEEITRYEAHTLQLLYEYSLHNDAKILYLHSKGSSHTNLTTAAAWRAMFEYYLIENYPLCLKLLDKYDACAPNFCYSWPIPENNFTGECGYFGGNLWWANTSHLRRLKPVVLPVPNRFWCELWIGLIRWRRFVGMFTPSFDICQAIILREDYENVFDFKEYVDWPIDVREGGEVIERRAVGRVFEQSL